MNLQLNNFTGSVVLTNKGVLTLEDAQHKALIFYKKSRSVKTTEITKEDLKKTIKVKKVSEPKFEPKKGIDRIFDYTDGAIKGKNVTLKQGLYTYKFSSISSAAAKLKLNYAELAKDIREGSHVSQGFLIVK